MCQLSSWIVSNDHVWAEMDRTGYKSAHHAAEIFNVFGFLGVGLLIVGAAGLLFLNSLWWHLFTPCTETEESARPE
jgi:hypothetical protein